MDFSLNGHQKLIRDSVRQFMEAEVRPFVSPAVRGRCRQTKYLLQSACDLLTYL